MPQKLNKAGKMQDYIPKGNGDASGEYGTSNGTNKNFTTSDKKKTEANVITENKSVVVGDKKELKFIPFKEWIKKPGAKEKLEKGIPQFLEKRAEREKKEKANIIDGDLTGKKEYKYPVDYNFDGLNWFTKNKDGETLMFMTEDDVKNYLKTGESGKGKTKEQIKQSLMTDFFISSYYEMEDAIKDTEKSIKQAKEKGNTKYAEELEQVLNVQKNNMKNQVKDVYNRDKNFSKELDRRNKMGEKKREKLLEVNGKTIKPFSSDWYKYFDGKK